MDREQLKRMEADLNSTERINEVLKRVGDLERQIGFDRGYQHAIETLRERARQEREAGRSGAEETAMAHYLDLKRP